MLKHAEGPQWALVINTLLEMKSDSIVHKIGDKVFIFDNELPESSELYRVLHAEGHTDIMKAMYWLGSYLYKRKKRTKKNPPRLKLIIGLGGGAKTQI